MLHWPQHDGRSSNHTVRELRLATFVFLECTVTSLIGPAHIQSHHAKYRPLLQRRHVFKVHGDEVCAIDARGNRELETLNGFCFLHHTIPRMFVLSPCKVRATFATKTCLQGS